MKFDCTSCPLRRHEVFEKMTPEEVAFMMEFKSGEMTVDPGATILMQGSNSPQTFTVLDGIGVRYLMLENGRRQVINFLFPGDFLGLQASMTGELGHSIDAVTPMTLCAFQRKDFWQLFRQHPERAYDLTWIAATEHHFLGETIASLGQRSAIERVSWALVRIYQRLEAVGLARQGQTRLPIRQQDLADALGLSLVHTNKTLGELRRRQLAHWRDGLLRLNDLEELARIAMIELEPIQTRPLI
ncbi:Crp/Fnr family transcriptional regulator [Wenxinia marina]|uniref:cAMP-binding protein n=1 Tax=Wenxinia marina DSM 24838 TaxID=1123501 RepID=A0A0D0P7B3_9RHOB|nr:Crp/Fnr family transcriptional regulator [Wenxinia marina]KIQ67481.1 cAMP-binding protein [Wenxinia marina DSM 24838]GGL69188.1 Crp/Fnr family transcriptional regulator [Wenxinia marina]